MNTGKTLFAQLMELVSRTSVARIVKRHGGNRRVCSFNCTEQFRVMAFAQLSWRESLRDIEAVFGVHARETLRLGRPPGGGGCAEFCGSGGIARPVQIGSASQGV